MNNAASSAQNAATKISAAAKQAKAAQEAIIMASAGGGAYGSSKISPTNRDMRGRFMSPAFNVAEDSHKAALAANQAMKAVEGGADKATGAVGRMNMGLEHTRFLLASFLVLGFIHFLTGAADAASDFQSRMLLLQTQARATGGEVRLMSEAVLDLSTELRTGPEALANSLYHIESVGIRGGRALEVMTTAAQGARVGNANLESVTNALVGALATGIKGVDDLSSAMGILDASVGTGNMTMEQFTSSLSSGILATGKTFGLSLQDIGAAMATMTDQAIPAREAATRLRMTIALLGAPTNQAANQLARIGLSSTALASEMMSERGLIGALRLLKTRLDSSGLAAEEQAALLVRAFGGGRSSSGIMTLLGSLDLMDQKLHIINDTANKFPELVALQAETAAANFQKLGAAAEVLSISVGGALLKVLVPLADILVVIASHEEAMTVVTVGLALVMGGIVVKAVWGFITATRTLIVTKIADMGATIALAGATTGLATTEIAAAGAARTLTGALAPLLAMYGPLIIALAAIAATYAIVSGELDKQTEALVKQNEAFIGNQDVTTDQLKAAKASLEAMRDEAKKNIVEGGSSLFGVWDIFGETQRLQTLIDMLEQGISSRELFGKTAVGLGDLDADALMNSTKNLVETFGTTIAGVKEAAGAATGEAMEAMAQEIRNHQNAPLDALKELHGMVRDQLDPMKEVARLMGMLTSEDLAAGLKSADGAVYAQAVATKLLITERLDEITGGAYSAGTGIGVRLGEGLGSPESLAAIMNGLETIGTPIAAWLDQVAGTNMFGNVLDKIVKDIGAAGGNTNALRDSWNNTWNPDPEAIASGVRDVNAALSEAAASSSGLDSAFSEIRQAANKFFDVNHSRSLQAIDDALKHKNAILDAKAALIQAPVTAAQNALDFQRRKIQEWRLRSAVTEATDPAQQRDAILALQDFLAQTHIDDMQGQVDLQKDKIEIQKKGNTDAATAARDASNAAFEAQKASFERDLAALQTYLEKHPGEWQNANEQVLALLDSYGIKYEDAGKLMGQWFIDGLKDSLSTMSDVLKALADLIPEFVEQPIEGPTRGPAHRGGTLWKPTVPVPEVPEVPVRGKAASELYTQLTPSSGGATPIKGASPAEGEGAKTGSRGGGTVVVKFGNETFGSMTDERLYVESTGTGAPPTPSTGTRR